MVWLRMRALASNGKRDGIEANANVSIGGDSIEKPVIFYGLWRNANVSINSMPTEMGL